MHELLEKYSKVAGNEAVDQLQQLTKPLQGLKITHVSSTLEGGGVAEILSNMVPLTNAFGIQTRWEVIHGTPEFFQCTKKMHNALQGDKILVPPSLLQTYEAVNKENAERLKGVLEGSDIVIVHDPQPAALIAHFPKRKGKWIWRCHIDASKPHRHMWKYIAQFASQFDASIFSLAAFTHPLPHPMFVIAPSIDPLSDKNKDLSDQEIQNTLDLFGIDRERPIILQVSRYDRFKDPVGVIEAFNYVKAFNPHVQLILAGGGASDDPEGEAIYKEVKTAARDDPDIHILLLPSDAHKTINALQRGADIILQKSIREGFGLTVTEALWKGKPVIGGNSGGIILQVVNHQTGFVINTPEGAAYRMRYLLQHPDKGAEMGQRGKDFVRDKFLITRHLREYLTLIYSLVFQKSDRIELPE
jgi:trehalose synthase